MKNQNEVIKVYFKGEDDATVKAHACDMLIERGEHSLPITTPQDDMIIVFAMQFLDEPPIYCDIYKYDGVIMHVTEDGINKYILMYNLNLSPSQKNWTIFKLMYYIKSGLAKKCSRSYINCDALPEAEVFASHYACPDVILDACKIFSSEKIMYYCDIPFDVAHRKAKYLKDSPIRLPFASLEKMIRENFRTFIEKF